MSSFEEVKKKNQKNAPMMELKQEGWRRKEKNKRTGRKSRLSQIWKDTNEPN